MTERVAISAKNQWRPGREDRSNPSTKEEKTGERERGITSQRLTEATIDQTLPIVGEREAIAADIH